MEEWKVIKPYIGAHIRVKVNQIYHHGIYVGDDKVVQFGCPSALKELTQNEIVVIETDFDKFKINGVVEVKIFNEDELKNKRDDEDIVKTARNKIGQGGYDFLHNNCEHFANYCVFGIKKSLQVDAVHLEIRKKLGLKK